ncbi:RNA-directed DNA polymerase [Dongia sp.]|uniref:RNA-directed DNA polymerase n=1 Tax=Dongia sp. TaxID=1977262 RepID=UPI0035B300B9
MTLKRALLESGYLPENMPPAFTSSKIADYLEKNAAKGTYLSDAKKPVRSSPYDASKRGMTRRTFSVVHPVTGSDLAEFCSSNWKDIENFYSNSAYSLSAPVHRPDGARALDITSHSELERTRLARLSEFRFIAKTDISRFYHSIYTHSIPWAIHGKSASKIDRSPSSRKVPFNRVDYIFRCGQDGQTIGIPVGPDASRAIAELIATAIDVSFSKQHEAKHCAVLRHVDDVWIGANSHADVETALWRYRECIREYELDINESKTQIYSENFRFSDDWPSDIASKLDGALDSKGRRAAERLRAALESAFSMTVAGNDDGVLKYTLRYLDQSKFRWDHWDSIEPFLKRASVHFGHTVDYVVRVIVWRHLTKGDLDIGSWKKILEAILDRHGRLGNDSEVCWAIYACLRLSISIAPGIADNIIRNCGALTIVALLNCVAEGLVKKAAFETAAELLSLESATGAYWPLMLEWVSRKWPSIENIQIDQQLIEGMAKSNVVIFEPQNLPVVFENIDEKQFNTVAEAIERRISMYDDDEEDDDEPQDDDDDLF